jgi:hypothetical protein
LIRRHFVEDIVASPTTTTTAPAADWQGVEEGDNAQHQPEAEAAAADGGGGAVAAVATMVERLSKFTPQQRKKSLSSLEHTFFHLLYSRPLILRMKKESECLLSKLLVRKPIDQA